MVGMKNFSIVLDSPTGAFYAGTVVSGRVLLSLEKPKTVRAINLKIEGVAKVSWSESESVRKSDGETENQTVHFVAEEEYFSNKFKLVGTGSGDSEIPIGDHVYPFSTSLPPLLPSSFEGEHGNIKYTVKAVMDRPWKTDHEAKLPFTIVAPLDLNYNAVAKEPVKEEREKTFCCFCCESGPLQLVVSIPHKGYVAGQSIPLTIEVDNASNVEVDSVICKLKKELKYVAHRPSRKEKSDSIELCKLSLEGVSNNGSKVWSQQLSIPAMPFVNLEACSIINTSYKLKVVAEVSGLHQDMEIGVPIIIGSVAIGEVPEGMPVQNATPAYNTNVSPGYGGPPAPGYGGPPTPGYGGPPAPGYGGPPAPGYGGPPAPGYGGPPAPGYGGPPTPGYGGPPAPGYAVPQTPGYGGSPSPGYGGPPSPGYGGPPAPAYGGPPAPGFGGHPGYPTPAPPPGAVSPNAYPPFNPQSVTPYPPGNNAQANAPSAPPATTPEKVPPVGFNFEETNQTEKTPLYPNPHY